MRAELLCASGNLLRAKIFTTPKAGMLQNGRVEN
jgi:hypothetical protein